MADYLKYQQRKLREQIALNPYNQLRSEISQVGRETQKISRQTEDTLKRQGVPLGARIEGARQLQTNYAQNIGSAFDRVSQQDQQRKQGIMRELDAVNMQIAQQKEQKDKALQNMAIQVGSTALGAGIGAIAGNPMLGAQIGSSAGQLISGGVGIASGDADEQDWANVGMGLVSGIGTLSEQSALKSVKAENTEAMGTLSSILNNPDIGKYEKANMFKAIQLGASQGMSMNEIMKQWQELNPVSSISGGGYGQPVSPNATIG